MRTPPQLLMKISHILVLVAGVLLIALTILTVSDVIGRAAANSSILGTVDISTLGLVGVAYLGLAAAELEDRHVSVDLIEMNLSTKVRMALTVVRTVLLVGLGAILSYGLYGSLASALSRSETTNGILRLATWPAKTVILVAFILFFICAIWRAVNEYLDFKDGTHESGSHAVRQAQAEAEEIRHTSLVVEGEDS